MSKTNCFQNIKTQIIPSRDGHNIENVVKLIESDRGYKNIKGNLSQRLLTKLCCFLIHLSHLELYSKRGYGRTSERTVKTTLTRKKRVVKTFEREHKEGEDMVKTLKTVKDIIDNLGFLNYDNIPNFRIDIKLSEYIKLLNWEQRVAILIILIMFMKEVEIIYLIINNRENGTKDNTLAIISVITINLELILKEAFIQMIFHGWKNVMKTNNGEIKYQVFDNFDRNQYIVIDGRRVLLDGNIQMRTFILKFFENDLNNKSLFNGMEIKKMYKLILSQFIQQNKAKITESKLVNRCIDQLNKVETLLFNYDWTNRWNELLNNARIEAIESEQDFYELNNITF